MASTDREPITTVWGTAPSGVQRLSPFCWGSEGEAPLKLKTFQLLDVQRNSKFAQFSIFFANGESGSKRDRPQYPLRRNSLDLHQSQEQHLVKVGDVSTPVHAVTTPLSNEDSTCNSNRQPQQCISMYFAADRQEISWWRAAWRAEQTACRWEPKTPENSWTWIVICVLASQPHIPIRFHLNNNNYNYHQWRRNEFESGGGGTDPAPSAGKKFWSCPSTSLALKVQLVVWRVLSW